MFVNWLVVGFQGCEVPLIVCFVCSLWGVCAWLGLLGGGVWWFSSC